MSHYIEKRVEIYNFAVNSCLALLKFACTLIESSYLCLRCLSIHYLMGKDRKEASKQQTQTAQQLYLIAHGRIFSGNLGWKNRASDNVLLVPSPK